MSVLLAACATFGFCAPPEKESTRASSTPTAQIVPEIDPSAFGDSSHHWRKIRDDKRVIQPEADQPGYRPEQSAEIAANILLFQRSNGGWPKDYDMLAVLTDAQREQLAASRDRQDTSFDNHNVFGQVEYLARVYEQTSEAKFRDACLRGLDFMLAAQMANGGFPQTFPKPTGYHRHITFNDGAMIGVLRVLQDPARGAPHFAWIDSARRERAADAVRRGVACILKCQIRVDGRLTGWCQQHDEQTYAPASARTFELASLCPQDTTEIVRFLMSTVDPKSEDAKPSAELIDSVEAAVAWLTQTPLSGVRIERVAAPREEFLRHTATFDVVVTPDAKAPPLWARHYEIGTNRPIFAGRDGIKKYEFAQIERERRTGTAWFGSWPRRLIDEEYPAWQTRLDR